MSSSLAEQRLREQYARALSPSGLISVRRSVLNDKHSAKFRIASTDECSHYVPMNAPSHVVCPKCKFRQATYQLFSDEDNRRIMGGGEDYKTGAVKIRTHFDYSTNENCRGSEGEVSGGNNGNVDPFFKFLFEIGW